MRYIDPKEMASNVSVPYSEQKGLSVLKNDKVALLDADFIKYIVTWQMFQKKEEIGDEMFYEQHDQLLEECTLQQAFSFFDKIDDPIIFCFSGPSYNTFRCSIAFQLKYKENRGKRTDNQDYEGKKEDMFKVVEIIQKKFNVLLYSDLEADDLLGMLTNENTYIISKDKDLKQIPTLHYNFETNETYEVSFSEGLDNLFSQLMCGDKSDNIQGIFRYGPKTFEKDFEDAELPSEYLNKAMDKYIEKYGFLDGIDYFCEMWFLVKMRSGRGDYLKQKYVKAFEMRDQLIKHIETKS